MPRKFSRSTTFGRKRALKIKGLELKNLFLNDLQKTESNDLEVITKDVNPDYDSSIQVNGVVKNSFPPTIEDKTKIRQKHSQITKDKCAKKILHK